MQRTLITLRDHVVLPTHVYEQMARVYFASLNSATSSPPLEPSTEPPVGGDEPIPTDVGPVTDDPGWDPSIPAGFEPYTSNGQE